MKRSDYVDVGVLTVIFAILILVAYGGGFNQERTLDLIVGIFVGMLLMLIGVRTGIVPGKRRER